MAMTSGIDIRFHSAEYRQCTVNGKKALFHRWVEKDQLLIKFKGIFKDDRVSKLLDKYKADGVLPACVDTERLSGLMALVEYEDGTMEEVSPMSVRFLDSCEKFNEFFWRDKV